MLQLYTRKVIEAKDVEAWKSEIINNIEKLNKENSRCKPIEASFGTARAYNPVIGSKAKDLRLCGIDSISFYLYAENQTQ